MNDLDFKAIGLKIKERRKSLGITQESIANALDVNPSNAASIISFLQNIPTNMILKKKNPWMKKS